MSFKKPYKTTSFTKSPLQDSLNIIPLRYPPRVPKVVSKHISVIYTSLILLFRIWLSNRILCITNSFIFRALLLVLSMTYLEMSKFWGHWNFWNLEREHSIEFTFFPWVIIECFSIRSRLFYCNRIIFHILSCTI